MFRWHVVALALGASLAVPSSASPHPLLLGKWRMTQFQIHRPDRPSVPFCAGGTGELRYRGDGTMEVTVQCPAGGTGPEPADAFGRHLFYGGKFEQRGKEVLHHISAASLPSLVGTTARRTITKLSARRLTLIGPFGPEATLTVDWVRP